MGNDTSSPEDDYPDEYAKFDGIETLGYRVLGVQPNSPAAKDGLVSFLDFLACSRFLAKRLTNYWSTAIVRYLQEGRRTSAIYP